MMAGEKLASFRSHATEAEPHRGQGGRVPVRPLPRRRHRARPRNGIDRRSHGPRFRLPVAFAKSQIGGGASCPARHRVRIGAGRRRPAIVETMRLLKDAGFKIIATYGTQATCRARTRGRSDQQGVRGPPAHRRRHQERRGTTGVQHHGRRASPSDSSAMRRAALLHKVPYYTTLRELSPRRMKSGLFGR